MKEQDKATAGDLSKRDINNIPDREFKVQILVGLQKRMEGIGEMINTEIRKIKRSIGEMRNTLDGMDSRLENAEEGINDLEQMTPSNNNIIGIPEEIDKGAANLVEEVMAENFPNLGKETMSRSRKPRVPPTDSTKAIHT